MIENLHFTKQLGLAAKEAWKPARPAAIAELMKEHWEHKRARSQGMTNERINHWHPIGMQNGALGGKLVGAGGGGYPAVLRRRPDAACAAPWRPKA